MVTPEPKLAGSLPAAVWCKVKCGSWSLSNRRCSLATRRSRSLHSIHVVCAKQKRSGGGGNAKGSNNSPSQQQVKGNTPAPARILPGVPSVKLQKQLVQAIRAPTPTRAAKVAYRKKGLEPNEFKEVQKQKIEQAEAIRNVKGKAALANLYGSNESENPPVLLVDGYNFIHKWKVTLALAAEEDGGFLGARDRAIRELEEYGQFKRIKCVLAFDAMGSTWTHSHRESRETTVAGLDVVYCLTEEADNFITAETQALLDNGHKVVYIASGDQHVQLSALGNNACRVTINELVRDMDKARKDRQAKLAERRGPRVRTSLPGDTWEMLNRLRLEQSRLP